MYVKWFEITMYCVYVMFFTFFNFPPVLPPCVLMPAWNGTRKTDAGIGGRTSRDCR
ncbi:unnamed protein product, partial [Staurois parvus]